MTIHLVNAYTSDNLGDAVIYETLAQLGGTEGVGTQLPAARRRHVRGLLAETAMAPADAFCSVGGDIFNNGRPHFFARTWAQNLYTLAACPAPRTFVFGQSIPPSCKGLALFTLAKVFKRLSSVTVRDLRSHRLLRDRGCDAALSFDTAFAYRSGADSAVAGQMLLDAAGLDAARTVLISVRGFDAMYRHDSQQFIARMAELIHLLRGRGHQPAVLLQAEAHGADSDGDVAAALLRHCPGLPLLNPFGEGAPGHPVDQVVGALALVRGVVAVRYHTAVLRLLSGRQAYNLYYSNKGADLSHRLHVPGVDLSQWRPADDLAQMEASFEGAHDPRPQSQEVRQRFAAAVLRAHAAGLPATGAPSPEPWCVSEQAVHRTP